MSVALAVNPSNDYASGDIQTLSLDELDMVDGAMAQLIGRGVMIGLAVVGCGTGVALVAGIAVGLAVAYYEMH